jgi:hypothetical protein
MTPILAFNFGGARYIPCPKGMGGSDIEQEENEYAWQNDRAARSLKARHDEFRLVLCCAEQRSVVEGWWGFAQQL